jgi:hypothetical protein
MLNTLGNGQATQARKRLNKGITTTIVVTTPSGNKTLTFESGVLISIT